MAEYVARKTMAELKRKAPKGAATFKRGARAIAVRLCHCRGVRVATEQRQVPA